MVRKLAVLAALGCMLLPALAAQSEKPGALRAMNTGKEHLRRDEFAMAIRSFTRYASLEPNRSRPYDLLACTYIKMDSLDLAVKNVRKSQQVSSDSQTGSFANWLYGIVLLRQDKAAEADAALAQAALDSPSVAGLRIGRARQDTDSLFVGTGDTEQSSAEYRLKLGDLLIDEFIDYQLFRENGNRTY